MTIRSALILAATLGTLGSIAQAQSEPRIERRIAPRVRVFTGRGMDYSFRVPRFEFRMPERGWVNADRIREQARAMAERARTRAFEMRDRNWQREFDRQNRGWERQFELRNRSMDRLRERMDRLHERLSPMEGMGRMNRMRPFVFRRHTRTI